MSGGQIGSRRCGKKPIVIVRADEEALELADALARDSAKSSGRASFTFLSQPARLLLLAGPFLLLLHSHTFPGASNSDSHTFAYLSIVAAFTHLLSLVNVTTPRLGATFSCCPFTSFSLARQTSIARAELALLYRSDRDFCSQQL